MAARREMEERAAGAMRAMFYSGDTVEFACSRATAGQLAFLCEVCDCEARVREANKRARLLRQARFPQIKSLEGYDFSGVGLPEGYTREDLLSLGFVERAEDFVLYGGCGLGKTHLAIALGVLCTQRGYAVRYFATADLVVQLKAAAAKEALAPLLKDLRRADVLVLDEFGYIPLDVEGARLLYQVMAETYETRSLVVTTNIEFSRWGSVLGDEKLARACVDRIVHHGRLIEFTGQSRRLSESLMMGGGQDG